MIHTFKNATRKLFLFGLVLSRRQNKFNASWCCYRPSANNIMFGWDIVDTQPNYGIEVTNMAATFYLVQEIWEAVSYTKQ